MFYTADKCKKRECGKKIYKAKHCWTLRLGLFVKLCCCRLDFLHEIKLLIMSGNARKLQKATTISPRFFEMWLDAACSRETLTLAITLSFVFEVGLKCKSCFIIWLIEVMLHVCILWKNTQNTENEGASTKQIQIYTFCLCSMLHSYTNWCHIVYFWPFIHKNKNITK